MSVSDLAISVTYRKHCHGEPEQERRKMMDTKSWFRRWTIGRGATVVLPIVLSINWWLQSHQWLHICVQYSLWWLGFQQPHHWGIMLRATEGEFIISVCFLKCTKDFIAFIMFMDFVVLRSFKLRLFPLLPFTPYFQARLYQRETERLRQIKWFLKISVRHCSRWWWCTFHMPSKAIYGEHLCLPT